jgi:predicted nucleotidyltransferase component of viral defense system
LGSDTAEDNRCVIDRDEIEAASRRLGASTDDVQRDYLYGWVLAGLYGDNATAHDRLVLKGGNAFRKGYFVNTRFSGDLDFAAPTGLAPDKLLETLNDICRMIQASTGVKFDLDQNAETDRWNLDPDRVVHKFTLHFMTFDGKPGSMTVALRMDVTEFGRIYLPIKQRRLIHPYSDQADCATTIDVISLEEALAEKLKCLLQRHVPHDLFDLAYSIFVNNELTVDKSEIVSTFLRKTIFGPCPSAALRLLLAVPFEIMRDYWNQIACDPDSRIDFTTAVDRFKAEIEELFSSFDAGNANQLAFFPPDLRTPIIEAGRSRTLLRVTYGGSVRLVEPYALTFKWRQDGAGQEYLYVWDQTGGNSGPGIKTFLNGRITSLQNTDITFEPRGEIELAKAGEYGALTRFTGNRSAQSARSPRILTARRRHYRVRCSYCQREFERSSASVTIRPHNDGFGNRCPGRRGHRV